MPEIRVIGLHIFDRIREAGKTQEILTRYGNNIRTRFGFHELSDDVCSREGIILLEMVGNPKEWDKMEKEINEIYGVKVKKMDFDIPVIINK
jgi:hypothetical protein